ncbi:Cell divisionFtsK/SpoIIIE protein [Alloactinosynnema sp. L-07]|uniref:FtsK/SpoIIIE domain-containing protein n=1 Tax=Alloactinosynnema sp. L-07 TaxID=1653480 RepID=UPI00065EFE54|nr:FtsK/SpoIIIE domain-containing protein [Alloactinosynnema sp. L-07]CRK56964.1 Cell divisionFtsK/SpoIIIE protein [Alloactinosynnema sp. L-07]
MFPSGLSLSWTVNGADLVEAFRAAKIIGPKEALTFPSRSRRDGAGWAVVVDLPAGRKASAAIATREALASALGVDEAQLVLERVRGSGGHAGRLACWVADIDPLAQPALRSPLQDLPTLSIWDGVPLGATARGRNVVVALCWTSWLIAGLPRYGKSNVLRLFLIAACLDPHTRIYAVDLKDGADFTPLAPVAHRLLIASAEGTDTEQTLLRLLALLIELENEVLDRYRQFKTMPKADVPEGKITRALAEDSMPWLVAAIDECQLACEELASDTKAVRELRRMIVDKLSWLVRKGPAAGVTVLLATQKPDRGSIPTRLRDNISSRIALRLPTQQSNDMALGTGKASAGVDATKFTERHRGAAWLLADDLSGVDAAEGVIVRAAKIDLPASDAAATQGRHRRRELGLLTGDAAGTEPPQPVDPDLLTALTDDHHDEDAADERPVVLDLLAVVLHDDETGVVATADLAARIGWDTKTLGEALWRLAVPAPKPARQRLGGAKHPVSVQDTNAIRAAIAAYIPTE